MNFSKEENPTILISIYLDVYVCFKH